MDAKCETMPDMQASILTEQQRKTLKESAFRLRLISVDPDNLHQAVVDLRYEVFELVNMLLESL